MQLNQAISSLDPWVTSSLLQKAIRRGDAEYAVSAGLRLHQLRSNGIWRRLMVIAHEDVGIGDLDLVVTATKLGTDQAARQANGGDQKVIADLARQLAAAPKDRSSDYLVCAAVSHPGFDKDREAIALLPDCERILVATDSTQPAVTRAIGTWYASGVNGDGPNILGAGDIKRLLRAFENHGLPDHVALGLQLAARKTKDPITIMLAVLWALASESGDRTDELRPVPSSPIVNGVPLYAFDKHTAVGKRAIARFAAENKCLDRVISDFVPDFRARAVAEMACFYADAAPVRRRAEWKLSQELEALGLEADMMKVGCPLEGIQPIVSTVRTNLDHLNDVRRLLLLGRNKPASGSGA